MIRKADISDIPAIQDMAGVVFRRTYKDLISPAQMEYMMDMMYSTTSLENQMGPGRNVFFIEDGRGYASYRYDCRTPEGRDMFHLEKLYVMPSEQGTGLGRQFFEAVCRDVRKASVGHPVIELNVNRGNPSVGFYEHLGMRKSRTGDFPIGSGFFMNDYIMSIEL